MRCLITGASGHVGAAVTRRFVAAGAEVYALTRPESDLWRLAEVRDRIRIIRGDLTEASGAASAIEQAAPEVVVHAAWSGVVQGERDAVDQMVLNVTGSLELFRIARAAGCRTWVGIGSQAEYGPQTGALHEDLPPRPTTAYGIGKLSLCMLLQALAAAADVRFVWLRLLATYGPQDDPRRLIPATIESLLAGRAPPLTAGEQRWDYLFVDDAAEAVLRVAESDASGVFNLSSGTAVTVRGIVERIRDLIDPTIQLGFGDLEYPPGQTMLLLGDIGRIVQATGWSPTTRLEEGLEQTVLWHRARRNSELE